MRPWSKITNIQIIVVTDLENDKICQMRSTTIKEDTDNTIILTQQTKIMYALLNYKNCKKAGRNLS